MFAPSVVQVSFVSSIWSYLCDFRVRSSLNVLWAVLEAWQYDVLSAATDEACRHDLRHASTSTVDLSTLGIEQDVQTNQPMLGELP